MRGPDFREVATPSTPKRKTRLEGRVCHTGEPVESRSLAGPSFPYLADLRKSRFLPWVNYALAEPLPAGCFSSQGDRFALIHPPGFTHQIALAVKPAWQ